MIKVVLLLELILNGEVMNQPQAKKIEYRLEKHGDVRIDNYFWLKERDSKDVIDYLTAENKYTEYIMKDYKDVQKKLYKELRSKLKEDDESFPYKYKNYYYFRKYFRNKEYPVYYRRRINKNKNEKILDVNEIAKGKDYCSVKNVRVSPDERYLVYAVDYVGRRFYDIYIKDLQNNKIIDKIQSVTWNFEWDWQSNAIFYVKQDTQTLRWQEVWYYNFNTKENKKIYFEEDENYLVSLRKSKSEKYIFLDISSTLTTEERYISADEKNFDFKVFRPREKELEYSIEDGGDGFYILHNKDAKNFMLSYVLKDMDYSNLSNWKTVIEHNQDILLEDIEVFRDFIVVSEREKALIRFRVIDRKNGDFEYIKFPDEIYSVYFGDNLEYDANFFRYNYESMVMPPSIYDYSFKDKKSILKKTKEIPNYNPSNYETKRLWIKVRDGVDVPVSMLYNKNTKNNFLYVYGYGSYGYSLDADFNSTIFPLVDRGFVYVIAHVRGGSEIGRKWYENGRQLKKKNTFYDFIDVTRGLVSMGYGDDGVFAEGGSAGGLLMGAIANMAPNLYKGIVAEVPFVDVLTTMLDDSIPLTTSEYDEWGNPNIKEYYDYIKSYSPYDNIERKCYPNILITAGYHDSQVQYWEPAKWAAKLREYNSCDSIVLLKTDMSTGHYGKTGRYSYLNDIAFNYSFVLKVAGIK